MSVSDDGGMADLTAFRRPKRPTAPRETAQPITPMLGTCKEDLLTLIGARRRATLTSLFGANAGASALIDLRPADLAAISRRQARG